MSPSRIQIICAGLYASGWQTCSSKGQTVNILGFVGCRGSVAAAAASLQSCPALCNPRDGSPPGSLLPGILQARTLHTFKYTIMVTSYHTMFSHNIVYYYGIMGILPLSHFNRQGKLRSREVKSNARSHIAGRWPRWDSYPDVLDSRLRGCSPSQTERSPTKEEIGRASCRERVSPRV